MADEKRLHDLLDLVEHARKEGDKDTEAKAAAAYRAESGAAAAYNPSEGGGTLQFGPFDTGIQTGQGLDRFLAGTGKAFYDFGRGARQIGAETLDAISPEARTLSGLVGGQKTRGQRLRDEQQAVLERDAPLMSTGSGKFGNITGNVAIAVPAMFAPGANTLAGSAVVGGLTGAFQPVTADESRLQNVGVGAVTAPAAILAGRGIAAVADGARSLVEPFTQNGQQAIAARVLRHFAGTDANAVAAELAAAQGPGLAGYTMTAAQSVDNAGLAQLERTLRNNPSLATDWQRLDARNRSAILDAVRGIARTPAELNAAVAARGTAADALYGQARSEGASATALAQANSRAQQDMAGFLRQASTDSQASLPANYGATLFGPGARRAALSAANGEAAGQAASLSNAAGDLAQSAEIGGNGFIGGLDVRDILRRPAIRQAVSGASETAANFGHSVNESNPVSVLHWAKESLDDAIGKARAAGGNARDLMSARDALLAKLEGISPTYRQGRETFAQMSGPVNRMEVGQELLNRIEPALSQLSDVGTGGLTPATFARAVQNSQGVVRNATGRTGELADVLTPDEMGQVNGVLNALARRQRAMDAGRAVGSNTGQNMVAQNILRSFAGPTGLPQSWTDALVGNAFTQSLSRGVTTVARPAEEGVLRALMEASQDPAVANALLRRAGQASVATRALRASEQTRALPLLAEGLTNSAK
jgi:hypothetical protein